MKLSQALPCIMSCSACDCFCQNQEEEGMFFPQAPRRSPAMSRRCSPLSAPICARDFHRRVVFTEQRRWVRSGGVVEPRGAKQVGGAW